MFQVLLEQSVAALCIGNLIDSHSEYGYAQILGWELEFKEKQHYPKTSSEEGVVHASTKTGRWWDTSLAKNEGHTMQSGVPTQSWYIQTDLSLLENRSVLQIKWKKVQKG